MPTQSVTPRARRQMYDREQLEALIQRQEARRQEVERVRQTQEAITQQVQWQRMSSGTFMYNATDVLSGPYIYGNSYYWGEGVQEKKETTKQRQEKMKEREKERFVANIKSGRFDSFSFAVDEAGVYRMLGDAVGGVKCLFTYDPRSNKMEAPGRRTAHLSDELQKLATGMGWEYKTVSRVKAKVGAITWIARFAWRGVDTDELFTKIAMTYGIVEEPREERMRSFTFLPDLDF